MQSRRINLLFDLSLALTGAAALWISPLAPAYGIIVLAAAAGGAFLDLRGRHFIPRHLLTAAGLAGFLLTILPLRREVLAEQSLAALSILLAVKLLGSKSRRDHLQILALAAVVTVGAGSLAPELAFATLIFIICVTGTFHLVWLPFSECWTGGAGTGGRLGRLGAVGLGMLVTSLPLALSFFLILPRAVNPFWGGLGPADRRVSGFSDSVDLGAVGRLALSEAVAFRAEMIEPQGPLPSIPYWRGIILEETDGQRWSAVPGAVSTRLAPTDATAHINYFVEPHGESQLFLLEQPAAAYIAFRAQPLAEGMVLRLRTRLYKRVRYTGYSRPGEVRQEKITDEQKRRNRLLPEGFSPRIRRLAGELAEGASSHEEIVDRVQSFFAGNFTYTLEVPAMPGDPMENFLFEHRRGYCEYFASAMAVMLRAAGVPCRLVAGYLGGEYNANGHYYLITQKAAHTWVEVWIEGKGWQRVDPTPAASEFGGTFASRNAPPTPLWLDSLRMKWNSWIVQYDAEVQMQIIRKGVTGLSRFRLPRLQASTILRWALRLLPLLLLVGLWRVQRLRTVDPLHRRYRRFTSHFARAGIARKAWEGPVDYGRRIGRTWPEAAEAAGEFTALWAALTYGMSEAGHAELSRLDRLLRSLPRRTTRGRRFSRRG